MRGAGEIAALVAAGVVPNLAYLALGLWMARGLRLAARGTERWALAYLLGSGAASLGILGLRALDLPVPLLALAALAALAALGAPAWRGVRSAGPPVREGAGRAGAVDRATLALGVLTFAAALGPETSWDGFEYHLPMVRAWTEGPIRALPAVLDAEFRAGVDLLYVPAVAAGWPDAAAAVSACFALSLAALIRAEASRRASARAGSLAGFFSLLVPFTLQTAPTAYVDLGVGAYGFAALLLADRWNRGGPPRTLLVSALCLGFAVNAKLHAAALAPAVLAIAALGGRAPRLRSLVACAAVTGAVTAPWFAKLAVTTGNPFFPFLGEWFGYGPTTEHLLSLRRLRLSTDFPGPRGLGGFLRYLASIHFGGNPHVSGLIGPLPLALGVLAWPRLSSRATAVLAATLAVLAVLLYAFAPALRFGSPLLPFLAVAAAVGGARLARSGPGARRVLAGALFLLAVHHLAGAGLTYLPRVGALRRPEPYRRARFPDQVALREVVARAEPVVAIPMGAVLWMPKPVYLLLWERNGELFFDRRTPPETARALLRRRGVRSLVLDVTPPLPADGSLGHPIVDAWLRDGTASLRPDPRPSPARAGKVWVLVDLH